MTENRRIFLNVVATYGRSLYALAIGLLCGRWALMALGEVDYGLYGLVGGLAVFISFINRVLAGANSRFYAFSVGAAQVSNDKDAALEECRHWFNTAISIHTIVPMVLVAVGYPLGAYAIRHWLTIPADRVAACIWVFRFVCISCFAGMVSVPFAAMYEAKQYIAELTIYGVVTSTLDAFVLHYMVNHPGPWLAKLAAWACFVSVVPQILICLRACRIFPECRIKSAYMWDRARLRQIGCFSGWQFLGVMCGTLRTQGMVIVVNKFFGAAMNAAQSLGNTVQAHCCTLAGAMQAAFVPVITQACGAGDYGKMNKYVIRTCRFNVLLSLVFAVPLALELPEVMRLWLKNPPEFATGLCFCALVLHLADCCTTGHMIAINANGKIAMFHLVACSVSIFTIPIAICAGLWRGSIYVIIASVIAMVAVNSILRLVFARRLCGTSIRAWIKGVFVPMLMSMVLPAVVGFATRLWLPASFVRVCITATCCEAVLLPLAWFVVLSADERQYVSERLASIRKRLAGGL